MSRVAPQAHPPPTGRVARCIGMPLDAPRGPATAIRQGDKCFGMPLGVPRAAARPMRPAARCIVMGQGARPARGRRPAMVAPSTGMPLGAPLAPPPPAMPPGVLRRRRPVIGCRRDRKGEWGGVPCYTTPTAIISAATSVSVFPVGEHVSGTPHAIPSRARTCARHASCRRRHRRPDCSPRRCAAQRRARSQVPDRRSGVTLHTAVLRRRPRGRTPLGGRRAGHSTRAGGWCADSA
jgi:hypothetical protein